MKKQIIKIVTVLVMAFALLLTPTLNVKAQDIGLPPAGFNSAGCYPAGKVSNYYYYSSESTVTTN